MNVLIAWGGGKRQHHLGRRQKERISMLVGEKMYGGINLSTILLEGERQPAVGVEDVSLLGSDR